MAKKVNIKELARRYTTAIFELAKSTNKLNQVGKDMEALQELLKSESGLGKMLGAKTLFHAEQLAVIKDLGKKFDSLTVNFLMLIAQNGRLEYLSEITGAGVGS